jgi:FkbM family methyltransferase
VIACEPDPHNYERLLEHLKINGYSARALNVAVADKPGTFRFTQGLDSYNHLVLDGATGGEIEVEAVTLDSILGDRHAKGVKIDVEGAERLVLAGACRALAEQRIDVMQFEWAGWQIEGSQAGDLQSPIDLLRNAGYSLHRAGRDGNLTLLDDHVEPVDRTPAKDIFAVGQWVDVPRSPR